MFQIASFKKTMIYPLAQFLTVALLLLSILGCQLPYLTQSAYNHLKIMSQRQSLDSLLKDEDLSPDLRHKFKMVLGVRPFIQELGLEATHNYMTYVDLKRPYVSYLLTVAPEYSLDPMVWSFPFVGKFPYKGFHNKKKAEAEAQKYQSKNYDTFIRGVSAYSTLGWFKDPLLSSMMTYSDSQLIETVIHESVHATVFIKNNVSFNEQLAVFVARKATLNYYLQNNQAAYDELVNTYKDEQIFLNFINYCIDQLTDFYQHSAHHNKQQKQLFFDQLKTHYREQIAPQFKTIKYYDFEQWPLNNAFFAGQKVYFENLDKFESKYKEFSDLQEFIQFLKQEEKNLIKIFDIVSEPS